MDDEVLVDREHPFLQPLEQEAQAVALGLEAAEGAPQLPAHPVEVVREQAELVAEPVAERSLEVALGDALRRGAEAA